MTSNRTQVYIRVRSRANFRPGGWRGAQRPRKEAGAMDVTQVMEAARAKAQALSVEAPEAELERLRLGCQQFFGRIPEPPLYRRANDPQRLAAPALIDEGQALLTRLYAVERERPEEAAQALIRALEGHLVALVHTRDGHLEEAEQAYVEAMEREKKALSLRRAWARTDEDPGRIYDKETGASRYDPRSEAKVRVRLACPEKACHAIAEYAFSPAYSTHRFVCQTCKLPFIAFFGEAREGEVEQVGHARRYRLKLEELAGGTSRIEFEDAAGADFHVARRDLLALLYTDARELRGVLNLTTSRLLWLPRGGPCFLATAAFGEGARELVAFRAFRDEVLHRSRPGFALERAYYRVGPLLALGVRGPVRRPVRAALGWVHAALVRKGYGGAPVEERTHGGCLPGPSCPS